MIFSVGLTGNIACGKTTVAQALAQRGCVHIDADQIVATLYAPGSEAWAPVVSAFGREILDPSGRVDHRKLAERAFANPETTARLNALIHPLVRARIAVRLGELAARPGDSIAVIEAALMIESGSYRHYDALVVVVCQPAIQEYRAVTRGIPRDDFLRRRERQMAQEDKAKLGDYVIENSGLWEETLGQVAALHAVLLERMRAKAAWANA